MCEQTFHSRWLHERGGNYLDARRGAVFEVPSARPKAFEKPILQPGKGPLGLMPFTGPARRSLPRDRLADKGRRLAIRRGRIPGLVVDRAEIARRSLAPLPGPS